MLARSRPVAGVLRKTDSTSWAWCGQVGKKHQRAHRNSKKHSRLSRLFFCYLLLAMYSNSFRPTASLKAVHIYTGRYTNTNAVSDLIIFIYAHAAEYFLVKSYLFSDTHSGAGHKQVLLEMLNVSMRNSVILHTVFQTLQCNRSV